MKKNVIINFFTLSITALLLVLVVMAWYITNEEVSVSGVQGSIEGNKFTLELQRGEYNSLTNTWTWEDTSSLAITNMQPGDAFFFRYKITVKKAGGFTTELSNIESSIDPDVDLGIYSDLVNHKSYVTFNGQQYAEMDSNTTKAEITVKNEANKKTLFDYDSTKEGNERFTLHDFKVEDTFKFYDYGVDGDTFLYDDNVKNDTDQYLKVNSEVDYLEHLISNTYFLKNDDGTYRFANGDVRSINKYYTFENNDPTGEPTGEYTGDQVDSIVLQYRASLTSDKYYVRSGTPGAYTYTFGKYANRTDDYYVLSPNQNIEVKPLKGASTTYVINELGIKYAYFALEFNDAASIVEYLHLDDTYKSDSNLYQGQILSIRRIGLKEN